MLEMSWRDEPIADIESWFSKYARRRYGSDNIYASKAWKVLLPHVLNATSANPSGKVMVSQLPNLGMRDYIWYDIGEIATAWDHFISAVDDLQNEDGYRFDLVDITRQFIVNSAPKFYHLAVKAYQDKNVQDLMKNSGHFLDMLKDLDAILATNKNFLLGVWLEDAKSIPTRSTDENNDCSLYEFNARNQITLWGPDGEILDYATKQWSGIVSDYYYPRWELFYNKLVACVKFKTTFDHSKYVVEFMEKIGKPFTMDTKSYPTHPVGDTIEVAKKLYNKWRQVYDPMDPFWLSNGHNNMSNDFVIV